MKSSAERCPAERSGDRGAPRERHVRVVGAGISGLAAAWHLVERGCQVEVDEAGPRAGGLLQTEHMPEGLVEYAARAFLWSPRAEALFAAAGVTPLFATETSKRRYIFRDGRPRRWPLGAAETLSLGAHGLTALVTRGTRPRDRESVATWGRRVLGGAGTSWLLAPALQGIYASPLEALSAKAIFGGTRVRGKLATPPRGMSELIDGLVKHLESRGVVFRFNSPVRELDPAATTVVSTPASIAATLLAPHAPALSKAIASIPMTNLLSVTAFFAPNAADTRGFGILFPRAAGVTALGVLFNTDMFTGRGELRSETWIYGDASADAIDSLRRDVVRVVRRDRRMLTGRDDAPVACYPSPGPQRLPIYGSAILDVVERLTELPPWLTLCGNYLGKIGVSNLIEPRGLEP